MSCDPKVTNDCFATLPGRVLKFCSLFLDDPTNDNYKDVKDATCLEGFSGAMLTTVVTNLRFQTYVMGLPGRKLDGKFKRSWHC